MANLSTYYPAPITAADLGLGAGSNATFGSLTANNGTLTGASAPVLDLAQTWNASGTTFTGLRFTVAETAAAIGSRYFSIDSGGTSIFSLQTRGANNGSELISISGPSRGLVFGPHGAAISTSFFTLRWQQNLAGLASNAIFAWGSDVYNLNFDLAIQRDAAHTLAQRIGTNPQTYNIYNTFTSATNHERGFLKWSSNVFQIGTEKGSGGGTARALEFQTDGVTRVSVAANGPLTVSAGATFTGGVTAATVSCRQANGGISFGDGFTFITGPSTAGVLTISAFNSSDVLVRLGGTSSSWPALNTSGSTLRIRLADNSGFAPLSCGALTLNGNLDASTRNIVTDTTTGTRIGTGTTQLLGFWNATPAAQPAAVADATDAASTQARLNDLLARLRTLGLIAT
jgi:hypothetical protein